jgi:DNA-binding NtrC family response regulator
MAEQYAYDLKRVGKFGVLVAGGGEEALDLLAREPIDCVVLDLEMPGTDGFRGVAQSSAAEASKRPVIVYTGAGSYDRCVQAVRLGAYGFVGQSRTYRTRRSGNRKCRRARTHGERTADSAFALR